MHRLSANASGFTLVEISIVMVIVGLLLGGVLVGRSLIEASELQSVISDSKRYIDSTRKFREKYNALPGDMLDATSYWGTDPDGCPAGAVSSVPLRETCDGDGDSRVECDWGPCEGLRFWQHLSNSGLLDHAYTGRPHDGDDVSLVKPGLSIPGSRMTGGGFEFLFVGDDNGSVEECPTCGLFTGGYRNVLVFARVKRILLETEILMPASNNNDPILTPEQAYGIDLKIDDGKPGYGMVLAPTKNARAISVTDCTTSTAGATATYNLALSDPRCLLIFKGGF